MKYLEIYNMNNILMYRVEVAKYQVGDIGLNFFTDGFDIDFDMFYKNPKDCIDEMNNKISYEINACIGEEYFKMRLVDEDVCFVCDKCLMGMVEGDQLFFIPSVEFDGEKTMVRYYLSFLKTPTIEYTL